MFHIPAGMEDMYDPGEGRDSMQLWNGFFKPVKEEKMSLAEDIQKMEWYKTFEPMEWYKTFEPYIRTKDIARRARGEIELVPDAPEEAKEAFARWMAKRLSRRF